MQAFTVTKAKTGCRLDQFLRGELPVRSRAFLQKLIEQGQVLVNSKPGKPSYKVRIGDKISVEVPPPLPLEATPEAIPLDVLFEDDDLIVVNKPAGLVVHPAAGNAEHTLVNALLHHCRGKLAGIGGVQRPGIVHRLDKGTSGCIVVAKTDAVHQSLVAQFKSRDVKKIYRAVCWGKFERPSGRIETTIGRSERDRKKMSARVSHGRNAITDYRVLRQFVGASPRARPSSQSEGKCGDLPLQDDYALVELTLHTGRTHQIRVHMAHIGHPLVGDTTYGRKSEISIVRPMIHAYKLGFTHLRSGKFMEFTAPVPDDIAGLCES